MWNDLLTVIRNHGVQTILVAILLCISGMYVEKQGVRGTWNEMKANYLHGRGLWKLLFYICSGSILVAAILGRQGISSSTASVFANFAYVDKNGPVYHVIENLLVFIPYTFLMMAGFGTKWYNAIVGAFLSSLGIELTQLIFVIGEFQLSDLLNNTLGGTIGAGTYIGLQFLHNKCRKIIKQKKTM